MNVELKDGRRLRRDQVSREVPCPQPGCGAQPNQPCIGVRGPRTQLHHARWKAWCREYGHLIARIVYGPPGYTEVVTRPKPVVIDSSANVAGLMAIPVSEAVSSSMAEQNLIGQGFLYLIEDGSDAK
jgi:hypothetical protein